MKRRAPSGRLLLGAHLEQGGTRFSVFTQGAACSVQLVDASSRELETVALEPLGDGYFSGVLAGVGEGTLYYFVLDEKVLPDPYARFLPFGVHGPARVVAPLPPARRDGPGRPLREQVIYELHVGTFTRAGTYEGILGRLPALVDLGVTTIELMPIAAFAGERGWGYDGVAPFAPHAPYGTPTELRQLIDGAHALGLQVLLDVVYNHFGPAGNYLGAYSESYFNERLQNPWGASPNFAEPALRDLVIENARYWLEEYGFDGLRLDATHALFDPTTSHVLAELAELAHRQAPPALVIAEDERNEAGLVSRLGLDAIWADDFHHQLRVSSGGERAGYYAAFQSGAAGVADVINRGWLYTGQRSSVTRAARGSQTEALSAEAFVYCIQNHDQIGNRALGERFDRSLGLERFRGASMLLLFLPMTPLLFMGQEWGASTPFLYFTDHEPELGQLVKEGRRREFAQFPEFASESAREKIPDPQARATFEQSQLDWQEREEPEHRFTLELYRGLLSLRREDEVLLESGRDGLLAEANGDALVVHRFKGNQRRVLVLNLGREPLALEAVVPGLRLRGPRTLLRSSSEEAYLLPGAALILAGEGNLAGLVESPA